VCIEPFRKENTVGVVIGFPSTVATPIPCGRESIVMLTFEPTLVVGEVTELVVVLVVLCTLVVVVLFTTVVVELEVELLLTLLLVVVELA